MILHKVDLSGLHSSRCFVHSRNIEEILASKGEVAKRIDSSTDSIEISAEDVVKLGQINNH